MARLRKASGSDEPSVVLPPATAPRTTRSSPRKTSTETPAQRELRYTSQESEESFLVPKVYTPKGETPRKQRILRPTAGNNRLLRKLSDESLASSERLDRRKESQNGLGYLYSKSLARTVARKGIGNGRQKEEKNITAPVAVEVTALDEEESEELERSICCGEKDENQELKEDGEEQDNEFDEVDSVDEDEDEDPAVSRQTQIRHGQTKPPQKDDKIRDYESGQEEDEEDDEDPIIDARNRRRHAPPRPRRTPSEEEDEETEEDMDQPESQRQDPQAVFAEPEPVGEMLPPLKSARPPHRKGRSTISEWAGDVIDLTSSPEPPASFILPSLTRPDSLPASSRPNTSSSTDGAAVLQYLPTPTKQRSPRKAPPLSRPRTPPEPPASPSKLQSPSKKKPRIPEAPHLRPSLDAFWSAEVVNTWNETHSPAKPLLSPRKQKWLKELEQLDDSSDNDAPSVSPTTSPRKKKVERPSPTKKTSTNVSSPTVASIRAQRKAFSDSKHDLAASFLLEIDTSITGGRIGTMCANTGGVKLIWSKTLKTTAGRANWRREQLRLRTGPLPTDIKLEYRHHCSIELAEKVIDNEERLYNVLAHEYCHLTTFMISEIRNNPHGAEFKSWGAKVTRAFAHKGVEVTTKHSYKIDYKYVWECVECGYEFKRHSKSVDPGRHSCGRCMGKLVQTKPVPRGGVGGDGKVREKSEYQVFVKANFSKVKKRLETEGKDTQLGKVMGVVAEEYKVWKERRGEKGVAEKGVVGVESLLEGLRIEDDET